MLSIGGVVVATGAGHKLGRAGWRNDEVSCCCP